MSAPSETIEQRTALIQAETARMEAKMRERELRLVESVVERQNFDADWHRATESFTFGGQRFYDLSDSLPPGWGFQPGYNTPYFSPPEPSVSQFADGENEIITSEQELGRIRAMARMVSSVECPGVGMLENLQNYIIGPGFTFTIGTKFRDEAQKPFLDDVQRVVDTFLDTNDFAGDLDRELLRRSVVDGEFFLRFVPEGDRTRLKIIEPAAVTECGQWPEVEGRYDYATNFRFGVHSSDDDPARPLGYAVVNRDGQWSYHASNFVEHLRCNVSRNTKRGLSDFFPAWQWLKRQSRLLANTAEGSAELAAISYIIQYASGVSEQRVFSMRDGLANFTMSLPNGRTVSKEIKPAGSVLNVPKNQEYQAGPAGHERGNAFLQVVQGILRIVATRWCATEGMLTGDDSNNNMASSIVAGSRFHRYAVCRQAAMSARFQRIVWKALRFAFDAGMFSRHRLGPNFPGTWPVFERLVELRIDCPPVDELSKLDQERILDMRLQNGAITLQTYREKIGIDHETEEGRAATEVPREFRQRQL